MEERLDVANDNSRSTTQLENGQLSVAFQRGGVLIDCLQEEGMPSSFFKPSDDGVDCGGWQSVGVVVRVSHGASCLELSARPGVFGLAAARHNKQRTRKTFSWYCHVHAVAVLDAAAATQPATTARCRS